MGATPASPEAMLLISSGRCWHYTGTWSTWLGWAPSVSAEAQLTNFELHL